MRDMGTDYSIPEFTPRSESMTNHGYRDLWDLELRDSGTGHNPPLEITLNFKIVLESAAWIKFDKCEQCANHLSFKIGRSDGFESATQMGARTAHLGQPVLNIWCDEVT